MNLNSQAEKLQELKIDAEFAKQISALRDEAPALERLNAAYLQTAEAVRAGQVEVKVAQFRVENPGAAPDQVAGQRRIYQQQSEDAFQSATAQAAAQYQIQESYDRTMEKLYEIERFSPRTETRRSRSTRRSIARSASRFLMGRRRIEGWDFFGGAQGALRRDSAVRRRPRRKNIQFNEQVDRRHLDAAREFVATGKSNFGELARSLEESVLKATFQKGIATIQSTITTRIRMRSKKDGSGRLPLGPNFGSRKAVIEPDDALALAR